ncbi:MAG TPA: exonuclease domain-containing protein [Methylophilaceae bacterium]|nr:exonuclease domain-containing protein [Methylophilaceae bacterium]
MNWLPDLVFLDLETTGGTPLHDRITEIALVRVEKGEIVDRWQTLVNPEIPISPFITQLTGITNEMVKNAPTFKEVAPMLYNYLDGMVMAAHNVRFDHGFLKAEYKRIGATLRQRVLCTVKLSRRLFPEYKSHSLDSIINRHGLATKARHRAMGDVQLMIDYLEAAKHELGSVRVLQEISKLSKAQSLPSGLDASLLDEIPDTAGVYLFYGENELPIYIGKSVTMRSRVLSHFNSDHASSKEMKIAQEVKRVEWIETAGELGALLLESKLIKEKKPIYNRMLRSNRQMCSLRLSEKLSDSPWVSFVSGDDFQPSYFEHLYGTFRTKKTAMDTLRNLATEHHLCGKLLGLESGKGACFGYQLKRCTGVCVGKESSEIHYLRVKQALVGLRLKSWPYAGRIGIREKSQDNHFIQVHVFDQWCHLGTVEDDIQLNEALQARAEYSFDLDTYKLLSKALTQNVELIHF